MNPSEAPVISPEEMLGQARALILREQNPSVARLQRNFMIGYNHALSLMKQLENDIVSVPDANGQRQMLILTIVH